MHLDLQDFDTARYVCLGMGVGSLVFQLLVYYGLEIYRRVSRPNADSMYRTPVIYLLLRLILHAIVVAFYCYFTLAPPANRSATELIILYGQCIALSLLACVVVMTGIGFSSMRSLFINIASMAHAASIMCIAFRTSAPFSIVAFLSAYLMALMTTTRTYKYKNQ